MARQDVVNFSAGPAGLPTSVLERAREELLDYQGVGASIMEMSHRGAHYDAVHHAALAGVRALLEVPETHEVIFIQGGATSMFGQVPMNFLSDGGSADYVLTGTWSDKALAEAQIVGQARVAGTGKRDAGYVAIPEALDLDPDAVYAHLTSNNTVVGSQFQALPDAGAVPLVIDMSSDIMSRRIEDWSKIGLIYAGAQKNLGPSGVVILIAARSLLERCSKRIPKIFRFSSHADKQSLLHTPPTFAIYLVKHVLDWIRDEGGVEEMARRSEEKARLVYAAVDGSDGFYTGPVQTSARSKMNAVFRLPSEALEAEFLAEAEQAGLLGLKGHRSVGGIRASLYNAVSIEGAQRLVQHMESFMEKSR